MDCDDEINGVKETTTQNNCDEDTINGILMQFQCLNTNEKDELVLTFQKVANELSYTTARFFLEMNKWNLQEAVGCYFDFLASSNQNSQNTPMPSARIVRELTVGLGESVTKNTQFTQSWLLENNGDIPWPQGSYLMSDRDSDAKMLVQPTSPKDTTVITVNLISPAELGRFITQFFLCTPNGSRFGPIIWSIVDVSDSGTLALTQQLSQLHTSPVNQDQQQQQLPNDNMRMDDDGCDLNSTTSNALIPHCSNNVINNESNLINATEAIPCIQIQNSTVAPQNSPNLDEDMMFEKMNSHNI